MVKKEDFTVEIYGRRKKGISVKRRHHETLRFTKKVIVFAGVSWRE